MAKDKTSFLLYCDIVHMVRKLPDEKAGELFKHILAYVNDENPITEDLILQIAFEPIKQQLKRDLKSWESELSQKSEGGTMGNLKRWHKDLYKSVCDGELSVSDAMRLVSERKGSDGIASVAVTVTDTVIVNVTEKKKKEREERKAKFFYKVAAFKERYSKEMLKEFYEYWTEHSENGYKMRFEKQDVFDISRRLSTWDKREQAKPRNTSQPEVKISYP